MLCHGSTTTFVYGSMFLLLRWCSYHIIIYSFSSFTVYFFGFLPDENLATLTQLALPLHPLRRTYPLFGQSRSIIAQPRYN